MVDPCRDPSDPVDPFEVANEFMLISSGPGFDVDDFVVDLDPGNNVGGSFNSDPGTASCPFMTPTATLISELQSSSSGCSGNIIAVGPGDAIPACALVLIFTDSSANTVAGLYDLGPLCSTGLSVYILQSSCNRGTGAFTNGVCSGNRTYAITDAGCGGGDAVTYDCSTFPVVD
jgi:hypothetical protein